jgi:hypothetical protein
MLTGAADNVTVETDSANTTIVDVTSDGSDVTNETEAAAGMSDTAGSDVFSNMTSSDDFDVSADDTSLPVVPSDAGANLTSTDDIGEETNETSTGTGTDEVSSNATSGDVADSGDVTPFNTTDVDTGVPDNDMEPHDVGGDPLGQDAVDVPPGNDTTPVVDDAASLADNATTELQNDTLPATDDTGNDTTAVDDVISPSNDTVPSDDVISPSNDTSAVDDVISPSNDTSAVDDVISPSNDTSAVDDVISPSYDTVPSDDDIIPVDNATSADNATSPADDSIPGDDADVNVIEPSTETGSDQRVMDDQFTPLVR